MFAGVAGRALPRNASHSRRPLLDGVGIIGADTTRAADGVGAVALAHGTDPRARQPLLLGARRRPRPWHRLRQLREPDLLPLG